MAAQKPAPPQRLSLYWNGADDVEQITRYTSGGYHPIRIGEVISTPPDKSGSARKYRILNKLGHGAFSTVWLASAQHHPAPGRYFALKFCVADADFQRELDVFRRLPDGEKRCVLRLHDTFMIDGPNGTHAVHVFNVLGSLDTISQLVRSYWNPRELCREVVQGLALLHRHGVVHGDLYMRNVGVSMPQLDEITEDDLMNHFCQPELTIVFPRQIPARPECLPFYLVQPLPISEVLLPRSGKPDIEVHLELLDLGSATIVGSGFAPPACTPAMVCAPEIMFEQVTTSVITQPATTASDIWALACLMYEIVFGGDLFYFASANDRLLGEMASTCGQVPPTWRSYWDSNEELCKLDVSQEAADKQWQELTDNSTSEFARRGAASTKEDFVIFCDLLRRMLKMDPSARPSIEEVLVHPWLT